ncbi:MAG: FAD/NAD(P)-binding protein [Janthinobacterium lividum]
MSLTKEAATREAVARPAARSAQLRVGPRDAGHSRAVAIIGAGFSGTMAAIQLRHALPADCTVYLFDRSGRFARGPAYAATDMPHLLNVRSGNMSALPDDPGHFECWLAGQATRWPDEVHKAEVHKTAAGTFATRRIYGRYLRALLFEEMRLSGGRVRLCADSVIGVTAADGGYRLRFASGREVNVAAVVVATGNLPSSRPSDGVVVHDPWSASATAGLRPDEPVLVVGTGLTMVDLALSMSRSGFNGPVIALSRRGLVPQRHGEPRPAWPCAAFTVPECRSLTLLTRQVRRRIREAAAQGQDWRAVIDGLRPVTTALWHALPPAERSRFLRHLRPYWDVHRHRLAPGPSDAFASLVERGVLRLKRGRVRAIQVRPGPQGPVAQVEIQDRGAATTETVEVQRVIYATGVGTGAETDGVIASLISAGLARTDPHGMGVEVTGTLRLLDRAGHCTAAAWALGPIVRGMFWECTAVPDIRVQAQTVAAEVARHLAAAA